MSGARQNDDDDAVRGEQHRLEERLEHQAKRMRRALEERRSLAGQTIYLGTLGMLIVLPVIGGAYLGRWLDTRLEGYSVHWTVSLILLGVMVGIINAWLFIRE